MSGAAGNPVLIGTPPGIDQPVGLLEVGAVSARCAGRSHHLGAAPKVRAPRGVCWVWAHEAETQASAPDTAQAASKWRVNIIPSSPSTVSLSRCDSLAAFTTC